MKADEKNNLLEWFKKADHDIIAAHKLLADDEILDTDCFHCQQAAEKYLKAFIIFKGTEIEKIHDLDKLNKECSALDSDFEIFDFKNLNYFAIDVRYPDDFTEPSPEEAQYYLEIAERVKALVRKKISPSL
jgi:HEPN domain-containing protein